MDDAVRAAMVKWPDVPACYGWLSLDRRGQWRLQDEPVRHGGLKDFLGRNYTNDAAGNWLVQNGPQQVFVTLAYAPWVFHLADTDRMVSHTGVVLNHIRQALLDEEGSLLLVSEIGIGLLDDRDLPLLLEKIVDTAGAPVTEAALQNLMTGSDQALGLHWQGKTIPLTPVLHQDVASRFGFTPRPSP